jgi:hypothetical protein
MAKLKIPSLQHVARNSYESPQKVAQELIKLGKSPPIFSYSQLLDLIPDILQFEFSADDMIRIVQKKVTQVAIRENFIEILRLLEPYVREIKPTLVRRIGSRPYHLGRDLVIPFAPPIEYRVGSDIFLPWFSFWRTKALSGTRLSLFVTVIDEILMQDPDLENANFQILDFSTSGSNKSRELKIIDGRSVPRLSDVQKREMLDNYIEGFFIAQQYLSQGIQAEPKKAEPRDDSTADLFPE